MTRKSTWRLQPVNSLRRRGFSLLELLAVVAILGIIASVAMPRLGGQSRKTKSTACDVQRRNIEVQSQLWFRNHAAWPSPDLSDIGGNDDYFPDGLPVCPVDGSAYRFDPDTERVLGHEHSDAK